MIKYLKYLFMAAITMVAATGCQEEMEDAFSTAPVAPTLTSNGSISADAEHHDRVREVGLDRRPHTTGTVEYALYAQYEETTPVQIGTTTDLTLSMSKADFHTLLKGIAEAPQNDTFDLDFYVTATDDIDTYTSERLMIRVYSYGDAVPAEATPAAEAITLNEDEPDAEVALLTWTPARLGYNEAITYAITASYNGQSTTVASELTETSYNTTVQALNELLVKTLALPAGTPVEVAFTVYAFSETVTEGVPSAAATIAVTAYELPYPKEEYIWIPGNHQGWAPATAPRLRSVNLDGVYTGFCYLDGEFKFTCNPHGVRAAQRVQRQPLPQQGQQPGRRRHGQPQHRPAGLLLPGGRRDDRHAHRHADRDVGRHRRLQQLGRRCRPDVGRREGLLERCSRPDRRRHEVPRQRCLGHPGGHRATTSRPAATPPTAPSTAPDGKYLIELYLQRTDSEKMYATLTAQ